MSAKKTKDDAPKKAEEPKKKFLMEQVLTYEEILENLPLLFWYKNPENEVVRASAAAQAFDARDVFMAHDVSDALGAGISLTGQMRCYEDPGMEEARWLLIDKILHTDPEGQIVGVMVFANDVTDLQRTQEIMLSGQAKLERVQETLTGLMRVLA